MSKTVDIVIPIYKPGTEFIKVLGRLNAQSYRINRIILINTDKEFFDDDKYLIYPNIEVHHITHDEFDHGKTRQMGMDMSDADYVLMMTMDAVPADRNLVARLVMALDKEKVAVAYARQLPKQGCNYVERVTRNYNYPDRSRLSSAADIDKIGIKAIFCSDACAMYNRRIHNELGGFNERMILNEDMVYAHKALMAGYSIFYNAKARVYHSHNYTLKEQFSRNFDIGVSHAVNSEIFLNISSESEGLRMINSVVVSLVKKGRLFDVVYVYIQSAVKFLGYLLGKNYRLLPREYVRKISMNRNYWE